MDIKTKRQSRLNTTPTSCKALFERAWAGKCSPREAIKAQCLECNGFDRQAITDCLSPACSLWMFRPFQKTLPNDSRDEADDISPSFGAHRQHPL